VKRCKKHFHTFPFGITVILGNNGYIWITVAEEGDMQLMNNGEYSEQEKVSYFMQQKKKEDTDQMLTKTVPLKQREDIVRVRNCIMALQKQFLPIYPETIMDVYESSLQLKPKDITQAEMVQIITVTAAERMKKLAEEQMNQAVAAASM